MIHLLIIKKLLFSLAPLAIFFILKRNSSTQPKKPSFMNLNKEKIIEGKIIEN